MNNISIVLADDHPLLLKGLEDFLIEQGFNIVASVENGKEALNKIQELDPDLAILDIEMPFLSGIEVAKRCAEIAPHTRIILLSYHKGPEYILKAKDANVNGFIIKEDAAREVRDCIRHVLKGEFYYSQALRNINTEETDEYVRNLQSLTSSQLKVLRMIANGQSTKEIAALLHLSIRTIEKHRSNISAKIGLPGQAHQLSQWALQVKHLL